METARQGKRRQVSKCSTKSPAKDLKNEMAADISEDLEGLVGGDDEPLYQEETLPPSLPYNRFIDCILAK